MKERLKVEIDLKVSDTKQLLVDFQIKNTFKNPIWILKYNLCDENNAARRKVFHIKNSQGQAVKYIGRMTKVSETPNNFIKLEPGEILHSTCNLSTAYEFSDQKTNYSLYYSASNHYQAEGQYAELVSDTISFSWPHS